MIRFPVNSIIQLHKSPKNPQSEVIDIAESKSYPLQELNLGIDPLYTSAGKADTEIVQNPLIPMVQSIQEIIQDLDSQPPDLGLPLIKSLFGLDGAQLFVFIKRAKLFLYLMQPAKLRILVAYGLKGRFFLWCQFLLWFEDDPSAAFQFLTLLFGQFTLDTPSGLIDLLTQCLLNMKPINDNLGMRHFLGDRIKITIPHINGYPADLSPLLCAQALEPPFDFGFAAIFQHPNHTASTQISYDGNIVTSSLSQANLINAYLFAYPSLVGFYLPVNGSEEYPFHPLIGQSRMLCYLIQGTIAGQLHYPVLKPLGIFAIVTNAVETLSKGPLAVITIKSPDVKDQVTALPKYVQIPYLPLMILMNTRTPLPTSRTANFLCLYLDIKVNLFFMNLKTFGSPYKIMQVLKISQL
jgi:hypothetical protein